MANTLRFKRGLASGIPTALAGEPLFTTDTFDLYIGNGTTNTRFQKYIASGATTQILRGDGSLYTFPLAISSPSNGQVLKYNGTSWVNDSDAGITGSGSSGQVAYFTGATTQAGSNNLFWDATNLRLGIGTNTPTRALQVQGTGFFADNLQVQRDFIGATTIRVGNSGTIDAATMMQFALSEDGSTVNGYFRRYRNGSALTEIGFSNALTFMGAVTGTPAERVRIFATGNFGIGTGATDSGQKLQVVGTAYFSGSVVNAYNVATGGLSAFISATGGVYTYYSGGVGVISSFADNSGTAAILDLFSGSTRAIRITTGANVLIGSTTDSGEKLQVTGTMKVTGASTFTATGASISMTTAGDTAIWSQVTNAGGTLYVGRDNVAGGSFGVGNAHVIYGTAARPMVFFTNATARMTLDASGNLGLGTASPSTKLEVFDTVTTQLRVRMSGQADMRIISDTGYGALSNDSNLPLVFRTNATERMRLDASGNLGLGVTPSYKLDVQGTGTATLGRFVAPGNVTLLLSRAGTTDNGDASLTVVNLGALQINAANAIRFLSAGTIYGAFAGATGNLMLQNGGTYTDSGERLQVTGTAKITGNLTVDTNTLFVDATNDFVGVGTTTNAGYKFRVNGTSYYDDNARFPNAKGVVFQNTGNTAIGSLLMTSGNVLSLNYNDTFTFNLLASSCYTGGDANFGIGQGGSVFGSGTRTMSVLSGTAPTSSQASSFLMYSQAVTTGNAAPHFRTENGAVIKLYQQTTAVGNSIFSQGGGNSVLDDSTFDGYTIRQIVKALRNAGFLQ